MVVLTLNYETETTHAQAPGLKSKDTQTGYIYIPCLLFRNSLGHSWIFCLLILPKTCISPYLFASYVPDVALTRYKSSNGVIIFCCTN